MTLTDAQVFGIAFCLVCAGLLVLLAMGIWGLGDERDFRENSSMTAPRENK